MAAARLRASPGLNGSCARGSEAFAGTEDEGPTIIVEIKATSAVEDDHRLQVACYGAMWLEAQKREIAAADADSEVDELALLSQNSLMSNSSEILPIPEDDEAPGKCVSPPELYIAYPNLGQLRRVFLNMDSFEFIHRIGFRKLHLPFDPNTLSRPASE